MGKKRVSELGSTEEAAAKAKKAVQLEQKKLREGKTVKASGSAEDKKDAAAATESLSELEVVEARKKASEEAIAAETNIQKIAKKARIRSKAYKAAKAKVDSEKTYPLADALVLLKSISLTKFDPTVELHITVLEKGLNKEIDLPHATGKVRRIAIADADTMAKIAAGKIDFDVLLASADQMGQLVRYAKVLGPRGLMPNPKNGTVVASPELAAKQMASKNSTFLKTEKDAPLIHTQVGKLSLGEEKLTANIQAILGVVNKAQKIVIKTTMSPAVKVQLV